MQLFRRTAVVVCTALTAALVCNRALNAQGPEREQEVKIPGTDLSLKGGWQMLFHQGCRFAVPASWRPSADNTLAMAPDGSVILFGAIRIDNWSTHKAELKGAFDRINLIHEDGNRRLWFEVGDRPRVQHYVNVLNGLTVCSAILEVRTTTTSNGDDTIRRIVDSVGAAPDK